MIAYLQGSVILKKHKYLLVLVNNVGYQVFVTEKTGLDINERMEIKLFTHQTFKEDNQELYGFLTLAELELFKNLVSVSGVGPKSALGVLNAAGVAEIIGAIVAGDPALLRTVTGIGPKTAERLVVELKSKMKALAKDGDASVTTAPRDLDIFEALLSLGYGRKEIAEALKNLPAENNTDSLRIRAALKILSKR